MPPNASPLGFILPMLPSLVDRPLEGETWMHEVKEDGAVLLLCAAVRRA